MALPVDPLAALADRPAVAQAVAGSRQACGDLRWHPALRRRTAEVRTESCVRAAAASAEVDGVRLPLRQVRAMVAPTRDGAGPRGASAAAGGAQDLLPAVPGRMDPVDAVVRGALRAALDSHGLARDLRRSPARVMARLHTLAAAELVAAGHRGDRVGGPSATPGPGPAVGADTLGRPRPAAAARIAALVMLLAGGSQAPGLVLAAVVDAECTTTEAFTPGAGVVSRALARTVVVATGLDPLGVVVPERHALADSAGRQEALAAYAGGTATGVEAWVLWWGRAVVAGADEGRQVADEVMAGRLA